jgi:hypothetical protein
MFGSIGEVLVERKKRLLDVNRLLLSAALLCLAIAPAPLMADDAPAITAAMDASYFKNIYTEIRWSQVGISQVGSYAMFEADNMETSAGALLVKRNGKWSVATPGKGPFEAEILTSAGVPGDAAIELLHRCGPGYPDPSAPAQRAHVENVRLEGNRIARMQVRPVFVAPALLSLGSHDPEYRPRYRFNRHIVYECTIANPK